MKKRRVVAFMLLIFLVVTAIVLRGAKYQINESTIQSYEDCARAGYPILDSFPEQCRTPGGKHFVRIISEEPTAPPTEHIVCDLDAQQCPDGTAVGRIGPNCEFAPCTSL